ncbi:protein kinase [Gemmatimonadota bacterium]
MKDQQVGHYKILEKLGAGGMGEVWLAEDTQLGRKTALKVLPAKFGSDPERLARLQREARAAAALNNPHVCTIYEVSETEDQIFFSMEYVDGSTLDELIPSDGLPTEMILSYGVQIAEGVAHAHENGILHRDLKSTNVMVTNEGRVKVLDFGLAKQLHREEVDHYTKSQASLTEAGAVVGTLSYIAPEVLRGEQADGRSDLWAIGVLLFQAATGVLPFQGQTGFELTSAILTESVPEFPAQVKPGLQAVIRRCLSKDPTQRYRSADQLKAALEALCSDISLVPAPTSRSKEPRRTILYGFISTTVLIAIGTFWIIHNSHPMEPAFYNERHITSTESYTSHPSFSPDGNRLAFRWTRGPEGSGIYIGAVDGGIPRFLVENAYYPVWSPDGRWIAYLLEKDDVSYWVYRILAEGGSAPQRIGESTTHPDGIAYYWGLGWSPDGRSLAIVDQESAQLPHSIYILSVDGEKRRLTTPSSSSERDILPVFSPDGEKLAFVRQESHIKTRDIYILPLKGGEPYRITFDNREIRGLDWMPDGKSIVFSSGRNENQLLLWWIRIKTGSEPTLLNIGQGTRELSINSRGDRIAYSIESLENWDIMSVNGPNADERPVSPFIPSRVSNDLYPDLSPDGEYVAYHSNRSGSGLAVWISDKDGQNHREIASMHDLGVTPRWSPDGRKLVFIGRDNDQGQGSSLYILDDIEKPFPRRLTIEDSVSVTFPSWSRDGQKVYFSSDRSEEIQVWTIPADGGRANQLTLEHGEEGFESEDGRYYYYHRRPENQICRIPVEGGSEEVVLDRDINTCRWTIWSNLILFFTRSLAGKHIIESYNLDTLESSQVVEFPSNPGFVFGMTVSSDGSTILFGTRRDMVYNITVAEAPSSR